MQRRAAAVYFVLFVLLGAGAYGFIQVGMTQPTADLDGPTYAEGDEFSVEGETYSVGEISTGEEEDDFSVTLSSGEEEFDLQQGENVTLGGVQHFAFFPGEDRVQVLPSAEYYDSYEQSLNEQAYYQERQNGVWGIVILSFLGAIVLLTAAYLPVKG